MPKRKKIKVRITKRDREILRSLNLDPRDPKTISKFAMYKVIMKARHEEERRKALAAGE